MPASKKQRLRNPDIDTKWFQDLLADNEISANAFAELIGVNRAGLSKQLNGVYFMTRDVIAAFAERFGQPYETVARHAGIAVPKTPTRMVKVIGVVERTGRIARGVGLAAVERPPGANDATVALAMPGFYDWIVYYTPAKRVEPEAFGRLSVCELESGTKYLRVLERGKLKALCGSDVIEGRVISASPVIHIKTV